MVERDREESGWGQTCEISYKHQNIKDLAHNDIHDDISRSSKVYNS